VDDGPAYTQREPTENEGDKESVRNGRHACTPCPDASRALMWQTDTPSDFAPSRPLLVLSLHAICVYELRVPKAEMIREI
jgi:hypothetical protein